MQATDTPTFKRSLRVGSMPDWSGLPLAITVKVELTAERFSVSAFTREGGGQMQDEIRAALDTIDYVPGWNRERLAKLLDLWDAWHLNDMTAGCEHQRAGIAAGDDDPDAGTAWDARPIDPEKSTNTYGSHFDGQRQPSWNMLSWVRRDEHPRGLLSHPCPECGYKFGSAWLTREIPTDVRREMAAVAGV